MEQATIGQLLALASAFSFACSNVMISRGSKGARDADAGVAFSIFVTVAMSFLVWLAFEGARIPAPKAEGGFGLGMLYFALAGLAALILGRNLIYTSIRVAGVIRASAMRRLSPFFSALLAFVILGEVIAPTGQLGMALIAGAVIALVARPWLTGKVNGDKSERVALLAYSWGIGAALAYAVSYLFRKLGLDLLPASGFGTMISALAGLGFYLLMALALPRYRRAVLGMFDNVSPVLLGAGVVMSIGQLLLFAALAYERISVVAMIGSMEMFFSTLLAVLIGSEKRPDLYMSLAGITATFGVILVALSSA